MPSRVVDILMEQGRQQADAARRSGAIWGGAVQQLGQIPEQLREQRVQKLREEGFQNQLQQQRNQLNDHDRMQYDMDRISDLQRGAMVNGELDPQRFEAGLAQSSVHPELKTKALGWVKETNDIAKQFRQQRDRKSVV